MRRIISLLVSSLLVVPSLGSDAPREYDDRTERDELQGAWQQIGAVWNGDITWVEGCVWTYRNGKVTAHYNGVLITENLYWVDASVRPARMDSIERVGDDKGKTWRHIYRIEGDVLWKANGLPGGAYPRSFEDKDTSIGIYKRVKK